jgi:uncharacterized protein (DUF2132 family)
MIPNPQPNNPLHTIPFEMILTQLVQKFDWAELSKHIPLALLLQGVLYAHSG